MTLASDAPACVTGKVLVVDDGTTASLIGAAKAATSSIGRRAYGLDPFPSVRAVPLVDRWMPL